MGEGWCPEPISKSTPKSAYVHRLPPVKTLTNFRLLQDNLLSPARKAEDPGVWLLYQSVAPWVHQVDVQSKSPTYLLIL